MTPPKKSQMIDVENK